MGRFEAGVLSRDAGNAAAEHGLSAYPGSSPDVGIVGYTVGGWLGWLSRRHGLACNKVRAIELVTADGESRRVDSGEDGDLFWALRGGGGSFAIVSAIEFDLVDLPEVFAGAVIYPADQRSGEVLRRYFEWTEGVPDEVSSLARFVHPPPRPQIPEPLRDRHLIMLASCYAGPEREGATALGALRELGDPVIERFEAMPPSQLVGVSMDPEEPVPGISHTASLRSMPDDAIDAFVETAGPDSGSPLVNAELRHAGGALATPAEGGGALSRIDAAYVFNGTGVPMRPEAGEAISRQIDAICDAFRPWSTGRCFYNFVGRPISFGEIHDPDTVERLRGVKQRYDPDGLIVANIAIGVA